MEHLKRTIQLVAGWRPVRVNDSVSHLNATQRNTVWKLVFSSWLGNPFQPHLQDICVTQNTYIAKDKKPL